jgi:hypothetical protein
MRSTGHGWRGSDRITAPQAVNRAQWPTTRLGGPKVAAVENTPQRQEPETPTRADERAAG